MISCASVRPQVRQARDKKAQKLDLECHAILRHQRALRVVRVGAPVKRPQYDNGEKQSRSAISSPPARITRPVRALAARSGCEQQEETQELARAPSEGGEVAAPPCQACQVKFQHLLA
jgi:hypothetical protein